MTVFAGDPIYSSDINTVIAATTAKPMVRLIQQSAQSFTSGTAAALTFGASSEDIDTAGFHDTATNTSRVTPTVPGYYECRVQASFAAATFTQVTAAVAKNGTRVAPQDVKRPDAASSAASSAQTTAIVSLNGTTDYVEAFGSQTSGGAVNTNVSAGFQSTFEVEFKRPL